MCPSCIAELIELNPLCPIVLFFQAQKEGLPPTAILLHPPVPRR